MTSSVIKESTMISIGIASTLIVLGFSAGVLHTRLNAVEAQQVSHSAALLEISKNMRDLQDIAIESRLRVQVIEGQLSLKDSSK